MRSRPLFELSVVGVLLSYMIYINWFTALRPHIPMLFFYDFKGSVQRKLRWVENGVNRSVGASDYGAGHSFVVLFRFHLGFAIFPFPVSSAEFTGEF
jgi:hypothetical protein